MAAFARNESDRTNMDSSLWKTQTSDLYKAMREQAGRLCDAITCNDDQDANLRSIFALSHFRSELPFGRRCDWLAAR